MAPAAWRCLFGAWVLALGASGTVLLVGEVLGQAPCNLCWFQRSFMFPLVLLLAAGCWRNDAGTAVYGLLLAAAGGAVAGFHALLYAGVIPTAIEPCGAGPSCRGTDMTLAGLVPLPLLSLATFAVIAALLGAAWRLDRRTVR